MAIYFRKRIKIFPGIYLNFSKKGISTTVGPKGANFNFGKNGVFLNTGIPGSGLYSRQKIGGGQNKIPNNTNNSNYASSANTTVSLKTKTKTILLAFFLGAFGAHRFYLRQYWKGIFSILFCWTYIPFIISLIDVVIFIVMKKDEFDKKYNNIIVNSDMTKTNNFSYQFYLLLKDFSKSLLQIVQKLQTNEAISERINDGQLQTSASEFIASCVIYDMIQISNILAKGKLSTKSLEATGLVLATNQLLTNNNKDMLGKDFDTIAIEHLQGLYEDIARQLLEVGAMENPMQISIHKIQDEKNNFINQTT